MKRISSFLFVFILLTLSACNLPVPGVEAPTTIFIPQETQPVGVVPTQTVAPMVEPSDTAPAPTTAPPSEGSATATSMAGTSAAQEGGGQPTETQVPATITRTPVVSFDPASAYGEPDYENPMQTANLLEWAQPETRTLPNNQNIRLQFKDGDLYVTGKRPDFSTWWFSYHTLGDAYIQMTFDTENCSGRDAYGIIFRGPAHLAGQSYGYVAAFTCDNRIWVFRLDGTDPWQVKTLVDEEKADAIKTGPNKQNVMGIQAVGNQFTIFANGDQVGQVEDDHFEQGRVGVFVRAASPAAYTYRVTDFVYWILGGGD
jgi:hypothetical protein